MNKRRRARRHISAHPSSNRQASRNRRLLFEPLEHRYVLSTLGITVNLFEDNGGSPGNAIAGDTVNVGDMFFAEILAEDQGPSSDLGVVSMDLDISWDAAALEEIDSPFDANNVVSSQFGTRSVGSVSDGMIVDLRGISVPNLGLGSAIGGAGPERFALLRFRADQAVNASAFTVSFLSSDVGFADGLPLTGSNVEDQTITVTDQSNPPVVDNQTFAIDENSAGGAAVGTVAASDADAGDTLTFAITGGSGQTAFAIDSSSGALTVADSNQLDFEATPSFTLDVQVTDSTSLTDTATITVNLNDVNETPTLADAGFTVIEGSPNTTVVGTMTGTDPDAGDSLTYTITGGTGATAFAIDTSSGQITVTDSSQLDSNTNPSLTLDVLVADSGGLTDGAVATVTVTTDNQPPVVDDQSFRVIAPSTNSTVVGTVAASDPDVGDTLTFAITGGSGDAALDIDSATGEITVANSGQLGAAGSTLVLDVEVTDGSGLSDAAMVTIEVVEKSVVRAEDPAPVDETAGSVTFLITISPTIDSAFTVTYETTDGSAKDGLDFTGRLATELVPANAPDHSIEIPILDDALIEGPEDFFLTIVTVDFDVTLEKPTATAIIVDDDGPQDDQASTDEDTPVPVPVLPNDVNVTSIACPDTRITCNTDNTITFDPRGQFDDLDDGESRVVTIPYTGIDAAGNSATAFIIVTVNGVNDAPTIDLSDAEPGIDFTATFDEDGLPVTIVGTDAEITDPDDTSLASASATITNLQDGPAELLEVDTTGTPIVKSFTGGVLTLTGPASVAEFQQVLRTLTYANSSQDPGVTPRLVEVLLNDGANTNTPVATSTVNVNAINDAPVVTVPTDAPGVGEDSPLTLSGISVGDVDVGTGMLKMTVEAANGTITLLSSAGLSNISGDGTSMLMFDGALGDVNAVLGSGLQYQGNLDFNGQDTVTVTANDLGNTGDDPGTTNGPDAEEDVESFNIDVNPINDAPVVTVPAISPTADEDTPLTLSGINVADVDVELGMLKIAVEATNGTISLLSTIGLTNIVGDGAATVMFEGTLPDVNAVLASGLQYQGNANFTGQDTITVTANDLGNTGSDPGLTDGADAEQDVESFNVDVSPINDTPVVTVPAMLSTDENMSLTLTGISVTDVDAGMGIVKVTVGVTNGTITLLPTGGVSNIVGDGTAMLMFEGTLENVNAALQGDLQYEPEMDFNGQDTVTVTANDMGNTGADPGLTNGPDAEEDVATFNIDVNRMNDAPVVTVPTAADMVNEDTPLTLGGISVADVDVGTGMLTMTVEAANGTITLLSTTGLSNITGDGTSMLMFDGTLADVNAVLGSGLQYQGNLDFNGQDTITVTANDMGNSGDDPGLTDGPDSEEDVESFNIDVNPINDAPVVTVPASTPSVNEDTPLTLGGISVADVDVGTGVMKITVEATSGMLTLLSTTGLSNITGDVTNMVMFEGTLADVNAVLGSGLQYQGSLDFNGQDTVTVTANDMGNTGQDVEEGLASFSVAVSPINDAPVVTLLATPLSLDEDTAFIFGTPVDDVDAGTGLLKMTVEAANGTIELLSMAGLSNIMGNNTSMVMFTGTQDEINAVSLRYQPNEDFTGQDAITVTANDRGNTGDDPGLTNGPDAEEDVESFNIDVNPINDAPVVTVPAVADMVAEDTPLTLSGISVADVDIGTGVMKITVEAASGMIALLSTTGLSNITGDGTSMLMFEGTLADVNAVLGSGLQYQGNLDFNGQDTVTVTTNDMGNTGADPGLTDGPDAEEGSASFGVDVNPINDAPVVTVPAAADTVNEDTPLTLSDLSVADVDVGTGMLKITVEAANGTITLLSTAGLSNISGDGTSMLMFDGALADVNAVLGSGLQYRNDLDFDGQDTVTVTVNDMGNTGADPGLTDGPDAEEGSASFGVDVNPINDAPVVTVPAAADTVNEDTPLTLSGISVADVDVGTGMMKITIEAANGTNTLLSTTGLTNITGDGTSMLMFDGTLADVNAVLGSGLQYQGNLDFNGQDTVTVTANDMGNTGNDPGLTDGPDAEEDAASFGIDVTALNDAPVVTVPGAADTVDEDAPLTLSGIGVADVDVGTGLLTMTVEAANGTITLLSTNGLSNIIGDGTSMLMFDGTLVDVNAVLGSGLQYQGNLDFDGQDTVTVTANDLGNTGTDPGLTNGPDAEEDSASFGVDVNPINDAPVVTVPGAADTVAEDTPLTLSGISVADVDVGTGMMKITIEAANGTITLLSNTGLSNITGDVTNMVMFEGTLADVNAVLGSGLQYQGNLDFNGQDTVTVTANDMGNTGADPGLTDGPDAEEDVASFSVAVSPVNDAPVVTVPAAADTVNEDTPLTLSGVGVADVDVGTGLLTMTVEAANGTITLLSTNGLSNIIGDGTSMLMFDGALADVNAVLGSGLQYQGASNFDGQDTVTVTANDLGNTGTDPGLTNGPDAEEDSASFGVDVNPINDAPVVTVPGAADTVAEDTPLTLSGISVADVDVGTRVMKITIEAANGTITLLSTTGLSNMTGDVTNMVMFEGTLADVNAVLGSGLQYQGNLDFNGQDTVTVTANDMGNTGNDPGLTDGPDAEEDAASFGIDVTALNDAPVVTVPATPPSVNEEIPSTLSGIGVADVDVGTGLLTMTVEAGNGTFTLLSTNGLSNIIGDGTSMLMFDGALADVNAVLGSGLQYQGNMDFIGQDTVTVTANDMGNTGSDPGLTDGPAAEEDVASFNIDVNGFNDAPVVTVPSTSLQVNEDVALTLSQISVADVDVATGMLRITTAAANGTITLLSTTGLSNISGDGTNTLMFDGALANVNAALGSGLQYRGNLNFTGPDTVTVTANDLGNTGVDPGLTNGANSEEDVESFNIDVNPINDPPVNTVPLFPPTAPLVFVPGEPVVFTTIQISDVDAGNNDVQITLSVSVPGAGDDPGTLTLTTTNGLTIIGGANGTASMTATGTIAAINAALGGSSLTFTPPVPFNGPATITVTTNDLGNTGEGEDGTDTDTVTLTDDPMDAQLGGTVYFDADNDGLRDTGEPGIPGVLVGLSGVDNQGNTVNLTAMTDVNGAYNFVDLKGGTYSIIETQPDAWIDGQDTIGTPGGDTGADQFSNIMLDPSEQGTGNNFGELGLLPSFISKRLFLNSTPQSGTVFRELNARAAELAGNDQLAEQIRNGSIPSIVSAPAPVANANAVANAEGSNPIFLEGEAESSPVREQVAEVVFEAAVADAEGEDAEGEDANACRTHGKQAPRDSAGSRRRSVLEAQAQVVPSSQSFMIDSAPQGLTKPVYLEVMGPVPPAFTRPSHANTANKGEAADAVAEAESVRLDVMGPIPPAFTRPSSGAASFASEKAIDDAIESQEDWLAGLCNDS